MSETSDDASVTRASVLSGGGDDSRAPVSGVHPSESGSSVLPAVRPIPQRPIRRPYYTRVGNLTQRRWLRENLPELKDYWRELVKFGEAWHHDGFKDFALCQFDVQQLRGEEPEDFDDGDWRDPGEPRAMP